MYISKYLNEKLVVFLEEETREGAISRLVDLLHQENKIDDKEAFRHAILEREKIVSTGIGIEVAIPHAKVSGKSEFFMAIGLQKGKGIDWKALDGSLVRLIFMIGGPDNRQTEYLKLLSGLTLLIKEEERRKRLLKCRTAKEVIDLFTGC
jgi:PTS system nitrogen regulatory IIA component